jgi:hypothetical protein
MQTRKTDKAKQKENDKLNENKGEKANMLYVNDVMWKALGCEWSSCI